MGCAWLLSIADNGYPQASWRTEQNDRKTQRVKVEEKKGAGGEVTSYEEQAHAFFPLYPFMVRTIACVVQNFGLTSSKAASLIVSAVIISNVAFVGAAVSMYKLTLSFLLDEKRAVWAAFTFCFNPASVFFSTAYTESLFAFLTFTALAVLFHRHRGSAYGGRMAQAWISTVLFAAATLTRSNGATAVIIFAAEKLRWLSNDLRHRRWWHAVGGLLVNAVQGTIIVAPYLLFQVHSYVKFCDGGEADAISKLHPWCNFPIPSLYGWVQSRYWGVGLLRYYQLRKIPNFLLAAPVIIVSVEGIKHWWQSFGLVDWMEGLIFWRRRREAPEQRKQSINLLGGSRATPLILHWCLLLTVSVLMMNIEVTTRFLMAACPPLTWWLSDLLSGAEGPVKCWWTWTWLIAYFIAGPIAHSNFLPWT